MHLFKKEKKAAVVRDLPFTIGDYTAIIGSGALNPDGSPVDEATGDASTPASVTPATAVTTTPVAGAGSSWLKADSKQTRRLSSESITSVDLASERAKEKKERKERKEKKEGGEKKEKKDKDKKKDKVKDLNRKSASYTKEAHLQGAPEGSSGGSGIGSHHSHHHHRSSEKKTGSWTTGAPEGKTKEKKRDSKKFVGRPLEATGEQTTAPPTDGALTTVSPVKPSGLKRPAPKAGVKTVQRISDTAMATVGTRRVVGKKNVDETSSGSFTSSSSLEVDKEEHAPSSAPSTPPPQRLAPTSAPTSAPSTPPTQRVAQETPPTSAPSTPPTQRVVQETPPTSTPSTPPTQRVVQDTPPTSAPSTPPTQRVVQETPPTSAPSSPPTERATTTTPTPLPGEATHKVEEPLVVEKIEERAEEKEEKESEKVEERVEEEIEETEDPKKGEPEEEKKEKDVQVTEDPVSVEKPPDLQQEEEKPLETPPPSDEEKALESSTSAPTLAPSSPPKTTPLPIEALPTSALRPPIKAKSEVEAATAPSEPSPRAIKPRAPAANAKADAIAAFDRKAARPKTAKAPGSKSRSYGTMMPSRAVKEPVAEGRPGPAGRGKAPVRFCTIRLPGKGKDGGKEISMEETLTARFEAFLSTLPEDKRPKRGKNYKENLGQEDQKRFENDGAKIISALMNAKAPPPPPSASGAPPPPPAPPLLSKPVERVNMISSEKEDMATLFGPKPTAAGLYRWRIENFLPVSQAEPNASDCGAFYTGDAYVVLNRRPSGGSSGDAEVSIHLWLGKEASIDKKGSSAIRAVQLNAYLGNVAKQHREAEGEESELFKSYFTSLGTGLSYLPGGTASAFKVVKPDTHPPRLYAFRQIGALYFVRLIPTSKLGLEGVRTGSKEGTKGSADVLLLDDGQYPGILYQWNTTGSAHTTQFRVHEIAQMINTTERASKAELVQITPSKAVDHPKYAAFSELLQHGSGEDEASLVIKDEDFKSASLIKIGVENGEMTMDSVWDSSKGWLKRVVLQTDAIFILDCVTELFLWFGRKSSHHLREVARVVLEQFKQDGRPSWSSAYEMVEGAEQILFKAKFSDWIALPQPPPVMITPGSIPKLKKAPPPKATNLKLLLDAPEEVPPPLLDDGTGVVELYVVAKNGSEFVKLPVTEKGQFCQNSSYVLLYTYLDTKKEFPVCVTYFWEGRNANKRFWASFQFTLYPTIAQAIKGYGGNPPEKLKLSQGKESAHFLSLLQNVMIIHEGSYHDRKKFTSSTSHSGPNALYHIRKLAVPGGSFGFYALQVPLTSRSLNSKDSFVLIGSEKVFIWTGSAAAKSSNFEALHQASHHVAQTLQDGRPVPYQFVEGEEPDDFWLNLGGKLESLPLDHVFASRYLAPPKLFELFITNDTGELKINLWRGFGQVHVTEQKHVYLLNTHKEVYFYIGKQAVGTLVKEGQEIGESYVKHLSNLLGTDDGEHSLKLITIQTGQEPSEFTRHFFGWNEASSWRDPDKIREERTKELLKLEFDRMAAEKEAKRKAQEAMDAADAAQPQKVFVKIRWDVVDAKKAEAEAAKEAIPSVIDQKKEEKLDEEKEPEPQTKAEIVQAVFEPEAAEKLKTEEKHVTSEPAKPEPVTETPIEDPVAEEQLAEPVAEDQKAEEVLEEPRVEAEKDGKKEEESLEKLNKPEEEEVEQKDEKETENVTEAEKEAESEILPASVIVESKLEEPEAALEVIQPEEGQQEEKEERDRRKEEDQAIPPSEVEATPEAEPEVPAPTSLEVTAETTSQSKPRMAESEASTPELPESIPEATPEAELVSVCEQVSEVASELEETPEVIVEAISEPESVREPTPELTVEPTPVAVEVTSEPKVVPEPETTLETTPEVTPEPEAVLEPTTTFETAPEVTPEPEVVPEPESITEAIPEVTPEPEATLAASVETSSELEVTPTLTPEAAPKVTPELEVTSDPIPSIPEVEASPIPAVPEPEVAQEAPVPTPEPVPTPIPTLPTPVTTTTVAPTVPVQESVESAEFWSQVVAFIDDLEDEDAISGKEGVSLRKMARRHESQLVTIFKAAQKATGAAVQKRFVRSARELLEETPV